MSDGTTPTSAADIGEDILLRCPRCGALFMAKREIIGKRAPCRECKRAFAVIDEVILETGQAASGGNAGAASSKPGTHSAQARADGYRPGDLVHTNFDGRSHWEPARVTDRTGDRLLLTTLTGRQFYTTAPHIRALEVIPGSLVVSLDEARGAYVPGVAHQILKDAVCVSDPEGRLHWRRRTVVFPDTAGAEARVVGRDSNKKLREVGRVCQKNATGYRIQYDDGLELPWSGNAHGQAVGIIPGAVSPAAPNTARSIWKDRKCVTAAVVLAAAPVSAYLAIMLTLQSAYVRLAAFALFCALYAVFSRWMIRSVSPLFQLKGCRAVAMIVGGTVFAAALACSPGLEGAVVVLASTLLAIGACWFAKPNMPPRIQPAHAKPRDPSAALPDRRSDYRQGERVFCLLPGEPFLRIATVTAYRKKQVEVELAEGATHIANWREVFLYEVAVQQRVLAARKKLNTYLPAVITQINDDRFAVRFDDGEAATCRLNAVLFPCRKEVLKMGPAGCQAMLKTVSAAMAEADRFCDAGDTAKAHETLNRALGKYAYDHTLHLGRAQAFEKEGKFAEAAAEAYEATKNVSANPVPYTILGNAHLKLRRYVEAEEAFRAAWNLAPDSPDHWHNIGTALLSQGEDTRAGSFFAAAKARAEELK